MNGVSAMKYVIGVDESGRGPVIGPLLVCAFACAHSEQYLLKEMGVRDSKQLTLTQRNKLAARLAHHPHEIVQLSAKELTELMARKTSLNEIEARAMARAVNALVERLGGVDGERIAKIIFDTPDPTPVKFRRRLEKYAAFPKGVDVVCEHKADERYAACSAASILAKVSRDAELEKIKKFFGTDFGNGYSHSPETIAFLRKHIRDPRLQEFIRHKWITAKRLKTTQLDLKKFV